MSKQVNKAVRTVNKARTDVDEGGSLGGRVQKVRARRASRRANKAICRDAA
jgi:hypothetical protein